MKKALRPNERTLISLLRKILAALGKTVVALILIALLAVFVTSVSPIYDFSEPKPFSGPDIFNPYKRAGEELGILLEKGQLPHAYACEGHPERMRVLARPNR